MTCNGAAELLPFPVSNCGGEKGRNGRRVYGCWSRWWWAEWPRFGAVDGGFRPNCPSRRWVYRASKGRSRGHTVRGLACQMEEYYPAPPAFFLPISGRSSCDTPSLKPGLLTGNRGPGGRQSRAVYMAAGSATGRASIEFRVFRIHHANGDKAEIRGSRKRYSRLRRQFRRAYCVAVQTYRSLIGSISVVRPVARLRAQLPQRCRIDVIVVAEAGFIAFFLESLIGAHPAIIWRTFWLVAARSQQRLKKTEWARNDLDHRASGVRFCLHVVLFCGVGSHRERRRTSRIPRPGVDVAERSEPTRPIPARVHPLVRCHSSCLAMLKTIYPLPRLAGRIGPS